MKSGKEAIPVPFLPPIMPTSDPSGSFGETKPNKKQNPGVHGEFQGSQISVWRPCLKNKQNTKKKKTYLKMADRRRKAGQDGAREGQGKIKEGRVHTTL